MHDKTISISDIERRRQMYGSAVTINDAELDVLLECARACRTLAQCVEEDIEAVGVATRAGKKVQE